MASPTTFLASASPFSSSTSPTPTASQTAHTTSTAAAHHDNTKHYLNIFIPIAIVASFGIVVVVAFMWWILSRLDRRRKIVDPRNGVVSPRTRAGDGDGEEMALPKYEIKGAGGLPEYDELAREKQDKEEGDMEHNEHAGENLAMPEPPTRAYHK